MIEFRKCIVWSCLTSQTGQDFYQHEAQVSFESKLCKWGLTREGTVYYSLFNILMCAFIWDTKLIIMEYSEMDGREAPIIINLRILCGQIKGQKCALFSISTDKVWKVLYLVTTVLYEIVQ